MNNEDLRACSLEGKIKFPPPAAGWWVFPGSIPGCETKFAVPSKPSWYHRTMMRLLLGMKWEDKNEKIYY